MKRLTLLFALALLFRLGAAAQTPYYFEDFNDPYGWEMDENWSIASGALLFSWSPTITNFDLSAISSEIELAENTQEIIIRQYLDVFGTSSPPEMAEIYIIASGEENLLWEHSLDQGSWGDPGGNELVLDISAFGGETVQFGFRTHGPTTYNWNYWNIYEFTLTSLLDNDLAVIDFNGSTVLNLMEPGSWDLEIKNIGSLEQSDFIVNLFNIKTGEILNSVDVNETLIPQQSKFIEFTWTPTEIENTAVYAAIESDGDEYPDNNISRSHFVRVDPELDFSILFWDNDNDITTIVDPEVGDEITGATGLMRALDNAGFVYDYYNYLPANYDTYDIIFATMGCYCLS